MNPIYVYGNGEVLSTTLHAISVLLYGHEDHLLETYFQLTVSIVSLWMALYIAFLRRWGYVLNWVVLIMAMNVILLVPTTRVTIIDILNHRKPISVDNVPVVLASIASMTTTLGHGLTEAIETHFSTPDSYQFHKTGSLFGSRITQDMSNVHIENAHFARTMKSFINQCVIQSSMAGITYNVREVKESPNLWGLVRAGAPQSVSFTLYTPEGLQITTCHDGVKLIEDLWTPEIDKIAGRLLPASMSLGEGSGEMSLSCYVKSHFRMLGAELGEMTLQGEDLIRQEIMMNEIKSVNQSLLSEYGAGAEYALAKAEKEQHVSGLTAGEIWSKTGTQLRNVLQIMMIASFLFLVPFLLFPRGWSFLIHYIQIMLSIELWAPLNAILNMIMYYHMNGQATSILGVEGLSILTTNKYHNLHMGSIAWASWIQGFIPFISYGLIKAGTFALDGLSHSFTNASHGAALGAAREMVSGNYQAGNVSIGNESFHSKSGFQQMMSPSHQDGQSSSVMSDGGQRTVNPDGSVVFKAGTNMTVSDLANSYALTDSIGQTLNKQYSQSLSNTETKSKEYTDAQSQVSREFADYSQRISKGTSTAEDLMRDISYGDHQSIAKMKDISQSIQQQHGLSQDQSAVIAAGIYGSVSTPTIIKGVAGFDAGVRASGDLSSRGSVTNAIQTAEDMAQRLQLTDNLDHAVRTAQSNRQSEVQGDDRSYQVGLGESMEQLYSSRISHQAALQSQEGLQRSIQDFENRSFNENQNLTQKLLQYTAHQPDSSKALMGVDKAYEILQEGGAKAQPFVEGFVEEYTSLGSPLRDEVPASYPTAKDLQSQFNQNSQDLSVNLRDRPSPLKDVNEVAQGQDLSSKGTEINQSLESFYKTTAAQWTDQMKQDTEKLLSTQENMLNEKQAVKEANLLDAIQGAGKGAIGSKIIKDDAKDRLDLFSNQSDNQASQQERRNGKNNN